MSYPNNVYPINGRPADDYERVSDLYAFLEDEKNLIKIDDIYNRAANNDKDAVEKILSVIDEGDINSNTSAYVAKMALIEILYTCGSPPAMGNAEITRQTKIDLLDKFAASMCAAMMESMFNE